jgi:hypothetical protein
MTGRNGCPPEWAQQLENLIGALATQGCAGVPLQVLCDAAGQAQGFAGVVYNCVSNQVLVLKFDSQMQQIATFATQLAACPPGGCSPGAQLFQTSDLVCVDAGNGVVREALQVIVRDATGAIVKSHLEDPATQAVIVGAVVDCPCE